MTEEVPQIRAVSARWASPNQGRQRIGMGKRHEEAGVRGPNIVVFVVSLAVNFVESTSNGSRTTLIPLRVSLSRVLLSGIASFVEKR